MSYIISERCIYCHNVASTSKARVSTVFLLLTVRGWNGLQWCNFIIKFRDYQYVDSQVEKEPHTDVIQGNRLKRSFRMKLREYINR
jgi:hypothetical protein